MTTGPDNPQPRFVTCPCQHCNRLIEFDASGFEKSETRTAECPHCQGETIIFVPSSEPEPAPVPVLEPKPPHTPPPLPIGRQHAGKGTILDYSVQTNAGLISGDDNRRYPFEGADWKETDKFPIKGMRVDFAFDADKATSIYLIQGAQDAAKRDCNHVVAGLLGIFLGFIGIHKFYMGYKKQGIILLLCGAVGWIVILPLVCSALIGLIEGIIYLSQTQQEFEKTYLTGKRELF